MAEFARSLVYRRSDNYPCEVACDLHHFGFVMDINEETGEVAHLWCCCCKQRIPVATNAKNNKLQVFDWAHLSKTGIPEFDKTNECWCELRERNGRIEVGNGAKRRFCVKNVDLGARILKTGAFSARIVLLRPVLILF